MSNEKLKDEDLKKVNGGLRMQANPSNDEGDGGIESNLKKTNVDQDDKNTWSKNKI